MKILISRGLFPDNFVAHFAQMLMYWRVHSAFRKVCASFSEKILGLSKSWVAFLGLFLCLFTVVHAKPLEITLTQGIDTAQPIAVVPFSGEQQLPEDYQLSKIIANDLAYSGQFKVLPQGLISEYPDQADAVNYYYWQQHQVDNLVIGKVDREGGMYKVSFTLLNVFNPSARQQILMERAFTVNEEALRGVAHHISDLVYRELTGDRGIFNTRIAYILAKHNKNGTQHTLEVADADGYNPRSLLVSTHPIMSPSWSPDGKQIAYVSFENRRAEIYIVDVASGKRRLISSYAGINGAPSWSPDGKKLAVALSHEAQPNIYLIDVSSGKTEKITQGSAIDTEPFFSADGKKIIFTSDRGGTPQIYQLDLASKKIDRLTFTGRYNTTGQLAPDGQSMVMLHRTDEGFNVAEQDFRSGHLRVLTNTSAAESPALAPNGKLVLYADKEGTRLILKMVSTNGRIHLRIPAPEGNIQEPAWSPFLG